MKIPENFKTFRLRFVEENEFVSFPRKNEEEMENFIKDKFSLEVDRANPDTEIWFLVRREGQGLIGLLLSKTQEGKVLEKGELRPELAHLLGIIAEVKETDTVFDSFAGFGSIPLEIAKSFEPKRVMAGDTDPEKISKINEKSEGKVEGVNFNALSLSMVVPESVDKIVTDPPWGDFQVIEDKNAFYETMLQQFAKVLKKDGLAAILMGEKELFEGILEKSSNFELLEKYDILVSGKKAAIYKMRRTS